MLRYGLDVKTPTTIPGDDPWKPVMATKDSRMLFDLGTEAMAYLDRMQAIQPQLPLRLVSIEDRLLGHFRRLE